MNKKTILDFYTQATFISTVWNPDDRKAPKVRLTLMKEFPNILNKRTCATINKQIADLDLRRRWIQAKLNDQPLPLIHPAVERHILKELQAGGMLPLDQQPIVEPRRLGEVTEPSANVSKNILSSPNFQQPQITYP
jgi:hypothetical protein